MITVQAFTFNPFQENSYVLFDESRECIIIDPGCYEKVEQTTLKKFIENNKLKPVKLINTHCHIDHVLGNRFVADTWNVGLEIHELDLVILKSVKDYCKAYGFERYEESPKPSFFLNEGEQIKFGKVILTFYLRLAMPLDTLFCIRKSKGLLLLEMYYFITA